MVHLGVMNTGISPAFWRNRRVLVTGHTGFKGGWLSLWLQSLGANVSGFSLQPPGTPSFFEVTRLQNNINHLTGDLRDPALVDLALAAAEPEVVFHLAAQSLVREGYQDPLGTLSTNVMGTANLLDAARQHPSVKAVVVVTSDKCYHNLDAGDPFLEDDALGGKDPYSASKACAEIVTHAWRSSFLHSSIKIASARAGNVIGGGDWGRDRLIPDALAAWSDRRPLTIRYPQATRPWQYHLDALAGYLMLAAELLQGRCEGAWNFGASATAGNAVSVEALLTQLAEIWGENARWQTDPTPQPAEAKQLQLDSRKAQQQLGWSCTYDIRRSLSEIVDWHRAWRSGADMQAHSLAQIAAYTHQRAQA